jgi:long-chain acyl-CoA synthetase
MYPGMHAKLKSDQPAFIMAQSGETVTYAELEARTNRLAHFLRSRGLKRLDHYAIFMENNARYLECCGAGERAGLYFTCINSFLTAQELAYIVNNSESKVLIFSEEKRAVAIEALRQCPKVEIALVVNGPGDGSRILNFDDATASMTTTPIADESVGTAMLAWSSRKSKCSTAQALQYFNRRVIGAAEVPYEGLTIIAHDKFITAINAALGSGRNKAPIGLDESHKGR